MVALGDEEIMTVSQAIQSLIETIEAQDRDLSHERELAAYVIKSLPLYLSAKRLDLWENTVCDVLCEVIEDEDKASGFDLALWSIFEFGRFNLYTQFDKEKTSELYLDVKEKLKEIGYDLTNDIHNVDNW